MELWGRIMLTIMNRYYVMKRYWYNFNLIFMATPGWKLRLTKPERQMLPFTPCVFIRHYQC